jgi:large subunit ribosomal protein L25
LNIVRRKVELKCPTENIPTELIVDLEGLEIGASIKISSINLPENVKQTIQGRDFVIATVAAPTAPTIFKEPEKPAEGEAAEDAEGTEGTEATATEKSEEKAAEGDKAGDKSKEDQKKEEKTPPEKK